MSSNAIRRTIVALSFAGAAGITIGYLVSSPAVASVTKRAIISIERRPQVAGAGWSVTSAPRAGFLEATLEPTTIVTAGGQEHMELSLTVANHGAAAADVKYAVELIDDRGVRLGAATLSPASRLAARASVAHSLSTKPGLADGYYMLRVTSAAVSYEDQATDITSLYFRIHAGEPTPVDSATFYSDSRVNQAVL